MHQGTQNRNPASGVSQLQIEFDLWLIEWCPRIGLNQLIGIHPVLLHPTPPSHAKLSQQVSLSIIYGLYRWNCLHVRKQCLSISGQDPLTHHGYRSWRELSYWTISFFLCPEYWSRRAVFGVRRILVCKDFGGRVRGFELNVKRVKA